jgi:hypothetical protein
MVMGQLFVASSQASDFLVIPVIIFRPMRVSQICHTMMIIDTSYKTHITSLGLF